MTMITIVLVIIIGLTAWTWMKRDNQLNQLQSEGFTISHQLHGDPMLVVDEARGQIALVTNQTAEQYPLTEIRLIEAEQDMGKQVEENHRLIIHLKQGKQLTVRYENAEKRDIQLQRLNVLRGAD